MARIGELLVRENLITPQQLQSAIQEQKTEGGRLGSHLVRLGYLKEEELLKFLSKMFGVPAVDLSDFEIDQAIARKIPRDVLLQHVMIPINLAGSTLVVAMADPSNIFAVDEVRFLTGYTTVEVVVASEESIRATIEQIWGAAAQEKAAGVEDGFGSGMPEMDLDDLMSEISDEADDVDYVSMDADDDVGDLSRMSEDKPVVKLVNALLLDAIKRNASDIHVEIYEKAMRVRFRIDGVLYEVMKPPLKMKNAIVSRLKIMSNLDIAERRLPQDGRIKLKMGKGREMDYRVSVLPMLFGEKVVLRLLDKSNLQLDMTKLGFGEAQLKDFQNSIHQPFGMVLVTGPTGSGKTTTLYSALSELNKTSENISTAEDPVEFNLMGINQVMVREDIGLTFAAALRSFLRQDPDIIMVGEIRDFETAEIAVKAALTGHMVLSTLHTNDAPSTINRLLNMGVEPFLVASAVNCILAQRLARRICAECKEPNPEVDAQALIDLGMSEDDAKATQVMKGRGCDNCSNTGYRGRVAIYEVMVMTDALKEFVLNGASAAEIKHQAIKDGMMTLRMSGLRMLRDGVTTPSEVLRVSAADHR